VARGHLRCGLRGTGASSTGAPARHSPPAAARWECCSSGDVPSETPVLVWCVRVRLRSQRVPLSGRCSRQSALISAFVSSEYYRLDVTLTRSDVKMTCHHSIHKRASHQQLNPHPRMVFDAQKLQATVGPQQHTHAPFTFLFPSWYTSRTSPQVYTCAHAWAGTTHMHAQRTHAHRAMEY